MEGASERKSVEVEPVVNRPRTLIHSSMGRQQAAALPAIYQGRPPTEKRVRYEMDHVVPTADVIGEFSLNAPGDLKPAHVISSVLLGNEKLVAADSSNKKLKLFNSDFKMIAVLPIQHFPVAMCESTEHQSELYASTGNLILRINSDSGLKIKNMIETDIKRIEGITTWEKGVAALFKSVRTRHDQKGLLEIHLFNAEGHVMYEIVVSSHCSVRLVTPVWYLATAHGGTEILLADTLQNRVLSIDMRNWQVAFVLRGKHKGGAPGSLAVDADGNMLIAWYGEVRELDGD